MFQLTWLLSGSYDWREQPRGSTEDGSLQEEKLLQRCRRESLNTASPEKSWIFWVEVVGHFHSWHSFACSEFLILIFTPRWPDDEVGSGFPSQQKTGPEREHTTHCVSQQTNIFFFLQGGFVTLAWHHHLLHPFLLWERGCIHTNCNSTTPQSLMMESVKPQSAILIIRNRTQVASKTLCRPGDAFKLIPFCTFFRCSTTLLCHFKMHFWS